MPGSTRERHAPHNDALRVERVRARRPRNTRRTISTATSAP